MTERIQWKRIALALLVAGVVGHREATADSPLLFARTYTRGPGGPVTVRDVVKTCDADGRFALVVENGPGNRPRVGEGTISVNGRVVVSQADLDPRVSVVERLLPDLRPTNILDVRLGGRDGGAISVKVLGWQTCVRFTSPVDGSTVNEPAIVVEGDVRARGDARVNLVTLLTVNGRQVPWAVPVAAAGDRFAARVRLTPGENRFVARVTDSRGRTDEALLRLTFAPDSPEAVDAPPPDVSPTSGFAPLAVTFTATEAADPTVVALDLDVDGDGRPEFALADFLGPPHQVTYTYATEGLYVAALTIRDETGLTRVTRVPIHVIPVPDLAATWETFRRALARADVDTALEHVALEARERYRRVFQDLRADLGGIAGGFGPFVPQVVTADYASGWIVQADDQGGGSYLVTFLRDGDGVWRLASF